MWHNHPCGAITHKARMTVVRQSMKRQAAKEEVGSGRKVRGSPTRRPKVTAQIKTKSSLVLTNRHNRFRQKRLHCVEAVPASSNPGDQRHVKDLNRASAVVEISGPQGRVGTGP